MTDATAVRAPDATEVAPQLTYEVAMPEPASHLFVVTLYARGWRDPHLDLKMAAWTPGSYLLREYARHVQDLSATVAGRPATGQKLGKNHWQIAIGKEGASDVAIRYRVYANDLTVRTNHLDATHGYFNPAALLMFVPGWEQQPARITIRPPAGWQISTPLPAVQGAANTFIAADFDTLVDSPFEIGTHRTFEFEAGGKPHELAIWGQGNANPEQIVADTQKLIETEAEIFGGLPYDRYLFLLHLSGSGYGGLEHKNACSLNYPRLGFRARDKYNRFMQLVAHEFFHLWNVKRIRPKELETFDYERENYTTALWFCEGTTSYYDAIIPLRAGVYDAKTCLENLSKDISRYFATPGRAVQPLGESSFDAWIKLYRRDAFSDNNQISYYLKGELVSFQLDLLARSRSDNQRSLDNVMRALWEQFGRDEIGFTTDELETLIATAIGTDLSDFFARYVRGLDELPLDDYLAPFGLKLRPVLDDDPAPYLGLKVVNEGGKNIIKFVDASSPAGKVGFDAGDELLAVAGLRATADRLSDRLKDFQPGAAIAVTVFHQDELVEHRVTLAEPQPSGYKIAAIAEPTDDQIRLCRGWLGVEPNQL
ncbi:putative protease with the C-terminal PDZ domain protein [Rubidibacter lacunae KORDI 51-2]|uniref:Putative protease with the C-terminal PDZ domain protein n=1 Tax=Rubidibacter lacunae KORDI 51-2 TaxID=582515 RepID=U5DL89_9CHRO|nr:M61 family metallopeptidase [Rubidibacter lacunae]ERN42451.1 putative protease with the C-terminal PDZ domain protein [Rubidibacter lacunae KORDI 51-2]